MTETFGHEPITYDGAPICRRCYTEHYGRRRPVPWPCTSAIVLGLTDSTGRKRRLLKRAEARVLTEIARGSTPAQAATRLNLTRNTVHWNINQARRRAGATSTVHLLALAIANGDIAPDCANGTANHNTPRNRRLQIPGASNYTP